jgi:hypothetical protein
MPALSIFLVLWCFWAVFNFVVLQAWGWEVFPGVLCGFVGYFAFLI